MKSKKLKNLIEIFVMLGMFCFAIFVVAKFSAHQYSSHEVRIKNLFNMPKNTIDVAYIGASEMYTGFSPEYLWKKHDITSYNIATAGAHMGLPENQISRHQAPSLPMLNASSIPHHHAN